MFHIVYKTTNLINGKIYIGIHSSELLDDDYLGSGVVLSKAIKLYGRENFKREILKTFKTREEAFLFEKEIVDKDFIKLKSNYNRALGGYGGNLGTLNGMHGKTHTDKVRTKLSKLRKTTKNHLLEYTKKKRPKTHCEKISKAAKKRLANPKNNPMYGKKHSAETRAKISDAQKGEKHWSYGLKGSAHPNYGKKHSKETKAKMSALRKGKCSIPAMCGKDNPRWLGFYVTPLGVFETAEEAAKAHNINRKTVSKYCKSKDYPEWSIKRRYHEFYT